MPVLPYLMFYFGLEPPKIGAVAEEQFELVLL
jgi:hypothetical protein